MADPSQPPAHDRFKAEMPHIPGVSAPGSVTRPTSSGGVWLILGGLAAVIAAALLGGKLLSKPRRTETPAAVAPQVDVPVTPELPVPLAVDPDSPIAKVGDLAKPWESRPFTFHNRVTGENVPALLVRLPTGSAGQASGYWSLAMRAAYGNCRLEYLDNRDKLQTDYGFGRGAGHPFVGNPCSRTVYDPLKYASLPSGVLARGAIVQGSDLRPPLGIEIQIRGKAIVATRME